MKFEESELNNTINKRRIDIAYFVLKFLLVPGVFALVFFLYVIIFNPQIVSLLDILVLILILVYICIISLIVINFNKIKIKNIYNLISIILFLTIVLLALRNGTLVNIIYLLAILLIILNSYIFEYKKQYFVYLVFISLVIILFLQNYHIIQFEPITLNSDPLTTFVSIVLLFIIYRISNIGFNQIEYSFNKAILYSKKLENLNNLNNDLDRLILERTAQFKNSLESQREALHQIIIAGKVARPIFHDLKSPLTIIKGNTELMRKKDLLTKNELQNYFNTINSAELQIERILYSAKELVNSNSYIDEFYIKKVVDSVLEVIKSETNKNGIFIQNTLKINTKLKGVMSSFERIIINLILNSMQAFINNSGPKKRIKIYEEIDISNLYIIIEDNGKGINTSEISKIFNYGYTTNTSIENIGIGLDFVKSIMQEQFKGDIQIDSQVNCFTKVILKFPFPPSTPNPSI